MEFSLFNWFKKKENYIGRIYMKKVSNFWKKNLQFMIFCSIETDCKYSIPFQLW